VFRPCSDIRILGDWWPSRVCWLPADDDGSVGEVTHLNTITGQLRTGADKRNLTV
jgi:hypothetical protein